MSTAPLEDGPAAEAPAPLELLLMSAGGRWFGLPLAPVREVVPARAFTRLPGAPAFVCGLVNLRGRIVTVLDLAARYGLPSAAAQPGHRVVVVEHRGRQVGIAVDDVARILRTDGDPGEAEPEAPQAGGAGAKGPEYTLLDVDALLQPAFA